MFHEANETDNPQHNHQIASTVQMQELVGYYQARGHY